MTDFQDDDAIMHTESPWQATSRVQLGGRSWTITLRQGFNPTDIDVMLGAITVTNGKMDEVYETPVPEVTGDNGRSNSYNNSGQAASVQPKPREIPSRARPASGAVPAGAPEASGELLIINTRALRVGGDLDHPQVEFFDANPRLVHPVLYPKSFIVVDILERRYGDEVSEMCGKLVTCGYKREGVEWQLYYRVSPKNPKWKDLVDIVIPTLERRNQDGTADD